MVKKKVGPIIIVTAFIVIICFSWLIWIFAEKYVDSTNYENREMATRPRLTVDTYETFSKEYDSYFNDSIPFRNNLITLNTAIDYFCFKKSTSDYVIVGKDDWLFYSREDDGDPVGCYKGTNLLSDEQLAAIAANCVEQRDFLAEQGIEFVIFIAPNKERIYYDEMPDFYGIPAEEYQAKQIVDYLKNNTDLRVVYPYDELMEAREKLDENLYAKTDTHWNYLGAYIGASALLQELGIEMPDITDLQIDYGETYSGDLASMLNLSKQLNNVDIKYMLSGYNSHSCETVGEQDFNTKCEYKSVNSDSRKLYVLRDSFATHMFPYLGSQFSESYFRHYRTYSYDDFVSQQPDIFVYESVERNVYDLADFSVR